MDSLTAQALRIVMLQNESEAINEVKRLKRELALWKGKVESTRVDEELDGKYFALAEMLRSIGKDIEKIKDEEGLS